MCLVYDKYRTKEFKREHKNVKPRQWITVYKKFMMLFNTKDKTIQLFGPYQQHRMYHVGINKSNRKTKAFGRINEDVLFYKRRYNRGIHVYLDLYGHYTSSSEILLPVQVKLQDLVACGNTDAVFMKIKLPQSSIDILLNKYPGYTFVGVK